MRSSMRFLPTVAVLSLPLVACSESVLAPSAPTVEPVDPWEQLGLNSEQVSDLLGALDDVLVRELPALENRAEAQRLVSPLEGLVAALVANERSRVVDALHLSRGGIDAYRVNAADLAGDLTTLSAIELVLERMASAAAEEAS